MGESYKEPDEYGKGWRARRAQKVGTFIWMINQHQDKDVWWNFINRSLQSPITEPQKAVSVD